ncbi:hypothetical protein [Flavobacterium laiguense]|uniref:Beta-carotene 15,15'-monooxygenase n=1 Tax=Flavobacterium laiguense TaxID=2169409 RepID=A0A2U1JQX5_9FLAO|nr:hypothetical protein [Flavobacterium laiguense]PWA07580.1 hypothetical protein DB891_14610 [Flavobacterium laiguense]
MSLLKERLHDIEKNGYQLDFGNVFNHAFENYKKIALYAGLVLFVFSVLFGLFAIGTLISFWGIDLITEKLNPENLKSENLSGSSFLIYSSAILVVSCLLAPFQAGFLKMADCGDKDEEFHISTLFSYYQLPYLKEIIVSTFLITSISFLQAITLSHLKLDLLGNFISNFISFLTILTIPLIIFGNLNAIEAIKYSIAIVLKKPFVLLGLIIVAIIGAMVGFIGCCIGVFFTLPFFYSMNYAIYSAIVGIDSQDKIEETNFVL